MQAKKPSKITGVKGMEDLFEPRAAQTRHRIESQARKLLEAAGFQEIRTPVLEHAGLFERSVGEATEIVEKEMYTLLDRNEQRLALRPEGTAPVVRAFIEHFTEHQKTEGRFFYMGPMFRYERPQKGRFRQFHQIGVEAFGSDHPLQDAELIALAHQCLSELGLKNVALQINSLGDAASRGQYREALLAYLKTKSEGLCEECRSRIERNPLRVLDCKKAACRDLTGDAPLMVDFLSEENASHFAKVQTALKAMAVPCEINPRLVRGLDYYEKTVFEFISPELGSQNTVCAGGRYNDLVRDLGGPAVPGVGWALGVERIEAILPEEEKGAFFRPRVYLIGLGEECELELFGQLQGLREVGVVAELDFGHGSLKSRMRRADRWGAQWVIIYGEEERKRDIAVVKSMDTGTQEEIPFSELFMRIFSKLPTLMNLG